MVAAAILVGWLGGSFLFLLNQEMVSRAVERHCQRNPATHKAAWAGDDLPAGCRVCVSEYEPHAYRVPDDYNGRRTYMTAHAAKRNQFVQFAEPVKA